MYFRRGKELRESETEENPFFHVLLKKKNDKKILKLKNRFQVYREPIIISHNNYETLYIISSFI